jgi:acetoin utilization deacetylase AcuC-like enzyme
VPGSLDVALPDGTGDEEYLDALAGALPRVLEDFRPGLVFYVAGADAHKGDRLGRLALTHEGLRRRDAMVLRACAEAAIPVAITLGGGYGKDLDDTVEAHCNTIRTAAEISTA